MRLEENILTRNVTAKAMDVQVTHTEEDKTKLMAENDSFFSKQEKIVLTMSRLWPRRCVNPTEKVRETISE